MLRKPLAIKLLMIMGAGHSKRVENGIEEQLIDRSLSRHLVNICFKALKLEAFKNDYKARSLRLRSLFVSWRFCAK